MTVNNWISMNLIWITLAITILVLMYFVYAIIQTIRKRRRFDSQLSTILLILGLMFLIFLTYHANEIEGKDWGQIILMLGLVIITALYASSTEKQANASVKMAEEMREQTIITSRPVMIQKAMPTMINGVDTDIFSHFEAYNTGKGPAIELQVSLLDNGKNPIVVHRETSLRAGESPIRPHFELVSLPESTYHIVCEYQSIFSQLSKKQSWYQTWLPFQKCKSSQGGIRVEPSELEFREVSENERVDAWHKLRLSTKQELEK